MLQSVYLPFDSRINTNDSTDDFRLVDAKFLTYGLQVDGIVPRTIGIGLKNTSYGSTKGETLGSGIGGIVSNIHQEAVGCDVCVY